MTERYKVQKLVAVKGRTAAGQKVATIGAIWETISTGKNRRGLNRATAERVAQHARVDNPNNQIRIEPVRNISEAHS